MLENFQGDSWGSIPPLRMPSLLPHDLCHGRSASRWLPAVIEFQLCYSRSSLNMQYAGSRQLSILWPWLRSLVALLYIPLDSPCIQSHLLWIKIVLILSFQSSWLLFVFSYLITLVRNSIVILKEVVRVGILASFFGHSCFDCKD